MPGSKKIYPVLLLLGLLVSCIGQQHLKDTGPTQALETAISAGWTTVAQTQTVLPTPIPTGTSIPLPGPYFTVVPPKADEQVYVDPEGWYSINLPATLKSYDKPNLFFGEGRFLETGYLPYMSRSINLCVWLANIISNPKNSSINWMPPCSVTATNEGGYNVEYRIYENPQADAAHRYIYVRMGSSEAGFGHTYVPHIISWRKAAETITSASSPLDSDELSFWDDPETQLRGITFMEYNLPAEAQTGPMADMLLRFVPEELRPKWDTLRQSSSTSQKEPTTEEQLKSLGYELKVLEIQPNFRQQLFRDGRILFDHVTGISKIYTVPTNLGPIHTFTVDTVDMREDDYVYFNSFLLVNDTIYQWENSPQDRGFAPILYQGDLLWAKASQDSRVDVKRSNGDVLFTFETYFATHLAVNGFQSWEDHWVLTADDFVIQDGAILNQVFGFQEIFEWSISNGKPVFLFRKGTRLGLSYDGKYFLLPYDDVAHGLCCGLASNNPATINDTMSFFGRRDGTWYYAVVKFR